MPIRWCLSCALFFALVACGPYQYRPTTPRRGALGEAHFEAVRLAQLHSTSPRYRVVLRSTASGDTRIEAIELARASSPACSGGVAANEVWVEGRTSRLPLDLLGEQEIEVEVGGADAVLRLEGDTALDLSLTGGCARVPLNGTAPERAWRPESRWSVGGGTRAGFNRSGVWVTSFVVRGGRWLGPVRVSLEAGAGFGFSDGLVFSWPFAAVTDLSLFRIGSFVVGAQVGYEAMRFGGSTVHGPRIALTFGLTPTDGAGIPRGPRQWISTLSVPIFVAYSPGANEPTLLVGFEWSTNRFL